jgi:hypothetical protein
MPRIKWEEKIYTGSYEDILKDLSASPWFGTFNDLKKRIYQFHHIDLTDANAKKVFETLRDVGEIEILDE